MIYAIIGKKQSGKSTIGKIWQLLDIYYNTVYYDSHKDKKKDVQFVVDSLPRKDNSFNFNMYHQCKILGANSIGFIKDNSNWQQKSFAHKLKQILCILFGCNIEDLENEEFKNSKLPEKWRLEKKDWMKSVKTIDGGQSGTIVEITYKAYNQVLEESTWNTKNYLTDKDFNYLPTYREALQHIGTDLFRNQLHSNWAINALFSEYQEKSKIVYKLAGENNITEDYEPDKDDIKYYYPNWLITDCRFQNEANAITERGGKLIKIVRTDISNGITESVTPVIVNVIPFDRTNKRHQDIAKGQEIVDSKDKHQSETELFQIKEDYTIYNCTSLESLIEQVKEIMIEEEVIKL